MSEETPQNDITKKTVLYQIPGIEAVTVRRDLAYGAADDGALTMDIYYPPNSQPESHLPAVVIAAGYPDLGLQKLVGCKFKEMGSSVSWAKLIAASGMVAITYTNREPVADLHALLDYVRHNAVELGIDRNRTGLWASSGNVPLALSLLMQDSSDDLTCAVLCYGYLLDLDGETKVTDMAKMFGFANPCAGKSISDLRQDVPLLIVRAGQDQIPHLNETLDRFVCQVVAANLPVTLTNYPEAPHAFDLLLDSATTQEIIRQSLAFLRFHLSATK